MAKIMRADDRWEDDIEDAVRSWCLRELAYWQATTLDGRTALDKLANFSTIHKSVFLLDISEGTARVREKPGLYSRSMLDDQGSSDSRIGRINDYRRFIELVLTTFKLDIATVVAIDVGDKPHARLDMPIFGFQKERNSPAILLPDVDFMLNDFYQKPVFADEVAYEDKSPSAIFIGSTSGGGLITKDAVLKLSVPRIRSAVHFKGSQRVEFRLPSIVQCDSPETKSLIESLGISGPRTPYPAQFKHKFIISMDGNGATCSRVVVALKSNCVLLKYDSPNMLYYFDRLIPWLHYIPIFADSDVEQIVRIEHQEPGVFAFIAQASAEFYGRYLSFPMVAHYTGAILSGYGARFSLATPAIGHKTHVPLQTEVFESLLHIQNVGDVEFGPDGWHGKLGSCLAIEGFLLYPRDPYLARNLQCRVMIAGGTESEWRNSGEFSGTRGKGTSVVGISFRILGPDAQKYKCSYQARCVGGFTTNCVESDHWCHSSSHAALEAFCVSIVRLPDVAAE